MSLEAGARLGPYEVVGSLGAGGMGEVYEARDTRLGRTVALKVLPAHLAGDDGLRQRLEREARAVSSLSHPHICALYDIGHQDGVDYLVLEYLEGQTLAQRLEKGPLPQAEALRFGAQIAGALAAAHGKGVVHRDLKPGNVMLTASGVKLLDFGLAKPVLDSQPANQLTSTPTLASPLTAVGTIMGTFQYMAPEQIEGQEVDGRTDIFAFGCILYEMLTGRRAFEGKSQASIIAKILELEPAPLAGLVPGVPPHLERLVTTCLAKDPARRWQSALDLERELRWLSESGTKAATNAGSGAVEATLPSGPAVDPRTDAIAAPAGPVSGSGMASSGIGTATAGAKTRLPWALALLLLVACAALSWLAFRPAPAPAAGSPVFTSITAPEEGLFLGTGLQAGPVTLSPDGRRMVFLVRTDESEPRLWLRDLGRDRARPLEGTESASRAFWSPDSRSIGFFSDGKLRRMEVDGGPVMTLADASDARGGTWNRDGQILFSPNYIGPIHLVAAGGGQDRPVTTLDREREESTHRYPFFLPDGRHFLYLSRQTGAGAGHEPLIYVGDLEGDPPRPLVPTASNVAYAAGHLIFVQDDNLMAQPFDPEALETTGPARPIVQQVRFDRRFSLGVFSASGTVLAYQVGEGQRSLLSIVDREGNGIRNIGEPALYREPTLSRDGRRVAFSIQDTGTGNGDIWIHDLETDLRTRLTLWPESDERSASWSLDGDTVVFDSNRDGPHALWEKNARGRGEARKLFEIPPNSNFSSISGDHAVYDAQIEGSQILFRRSLEADAEPAPMAGGEALGPGSAWSGEISPDGRWLLYSSDETGRSEVYVTPFPEGGGRWQISTEGGEEAVWRADGAEVYYLTLDYSLVAVPLAISGDSLQVGRAEQMFRLPATTSPGMRFDTFPDGQRFVINRTPGNAQDAPVTLLLNWPALLEKR